MKEVFIKVTGLVLTLFCVFYVSFITNDSTIFASALILPLLGYFILKKDFSFFLLSFLINASFIYVFTSSYILDTNDIFIPGGDAENFYIKIIQIASGDYTFYFGRYKLFLTIVSSYYSFLNFLSIGSNSPYHFMLLSCFFGAVGNVYILKILRTILNNRQSINTFLIICFFPIILKYSTGTLREIYAYPFIFIYIYNFLKIKEGKKRYLALAMSVFFILGIRLEWVLALFSFTLFYIISGLDLVKKTKMLFLIALGSIFFVFMVINFVDFIGFDGFKNYNSEKFSRIMNDEDSLRSEYSIASKLMKFGVIGRIMLFFFALISPFPPPIIRINNSVIEPLLVSIGAIYFYLNIPIIYLSIKKSLKSAKLKKITYGFLGMIISTCLLLAFTTVGSYRHKLFLFPIFLIYIPIFNNYYSNRTKKQIYGIMFFIVLVLLISYLTLK